MMSHAGLEVDLVEGVGSVFCSTSIVQGFKHQKFFDGVQDAKPEPMNYRLRTKEDLGWDAHDSRQSSRTSVY